MIHAPYKTIWSSATLPAQAQLPTLVENFKRQFDVGNDNVHALTSMPRSSHPHPYSHLPAHIPAPTVPPQVHELISMQLNVGVLLVKANGQVALPHSLCAPGGMGDAAADAVSCLDKLKDFVGRLKEEPLLLKAYTAQARALPSHLAAAQFHASTAIYSHP